MQWPNTNIQGEQPSEGIAALPLLMQWAVVTYHFLRQLRPTVNCEVPWLNMPRSEASIHMPCRCSFPTVQLCLPSAVATNLLTQFELRACLERSSTGLRNHVTQKATKERARGLTWRGTGTEGRVADQTLSILLHVQTDVESVQARFRSVSTPDLRYTAAKQILAAHGVNLEKRKLAPFQIR